MRQQQQQEEGRQQKLLHDQFYRDGHHYEDDPDVAEDVTVVADDVSARPLRNKDYAPEPVNSMYPIAKESRSAAPLTTAVLKS